MSKKKGGGLMILYKYNNFLVNKIETIHKYIFVIQCQIYSLELIKDDFSLHVGYPKIKPLHISENGVFMLLNKIDISKSSRPDTLPGRLLQSLAKEVTPVVHVIITQSLCTGELPT